MGIDTSIDVYLLAIGKYLNIAKNTVSAYVLYVFTHLDKIYNFGYIYLFVFLYRKHSIAIKSIKQVERKPEIS